MAMDVFDLVATLRLDSSQYENALRELEGKGGTASAALSSSASEGVDSFDKVEKKSGKIGSALATAAKVGAAAVGAASTAVGVFVKQSTDAYANYEQLVGGVETLFGDSANKVLKNADNAFKTAGMSANQYMETSIQSAASLINSLEGDQEKAAELMNVSITDMSDKMLVRLKRIEPYQGCGAKRPQEMAA